MKSNLCGVAHTSRSTSYWDSNTHGCLLCSTHLIVNRRYINKAGRNIARTSLNLHVWKLQFSKQKVEHFFIRIARMKNEETDFRNSNTAAVCQCYRRTRSSPDPVLGPVPVQPTRLTLFSRTRLPVRLVSSSRVSAVASFKVSGSRRPRHPAESPLRQKTVKGTEEWRTRWDTQEYQAEVGHLFSDRSPWFSDWYLPMLLTASD